MGQFAGVLSLFIYRFAGYSKTPKNPLHAAAALCSIYKASLHTAVALCSTYKAFLHTAAASCSTNKAFLHTAAASCSTYKVFLHAAAEFFNSKTHLKSNIFLCFQQINSKISISQLLKVPLSLNEWLNQTQFFINILFWSSDNLRRVNPFFAREKVGYNAGD